VQTLVQSTDHLQTQAPFSVKYLEHTTTGADVRLQIFGGESRLLHFELNGVDRVCWAERIMLTLISLDERDQNLHLIGLWGPVRCLKNQLQSLKGYFQVIVISDGLNIH
jgi:hypothetical protein